MPLLLTNLLSFLLTAKFLKRHLYYWPSKQGADLCLSSCSRDCNVYQ